MKNKVFLNAARRIFNKRNLLCSGALRNEHISFTIEFLDVFTPEKDVDLWFGGVHYLENQEHRVMAFLLMHEIYNSK